MLQKLQGQRRETRRRETTSILGFAARLFGSLSFLRTLVVRRVFVPPPLLEPSFSALFASHGRRRLGRNSAIDRVRFIMGFASRTLGRISTLVFIDKSARERRQGRRGDGATVGSGMSCE
ncbi:Hypothetical protein UVM_LOCUS338 [uncultured virus]|nr:Hypothetical protein UVM_LOCUS338 [uncultured virus]